MGEPMVPHGPPPWRRRSASAVWAPAGQARLRPGARLTSSMKSRDARELLRSRARELGPYTLLRVERGDIDPGRPGQFFMLEAPGRLLPRPMSLCLAPPGELAFLIEALGRGTQALCALEPGEAIHVLGPLGNGFDLDVPRPLLVGGGVGIAPLPYLSEALGEPPAVLGFRSTHHAEAAALLPGAEVVIDPVLVTEVDPAGPRHPRLRPGADAPRDRADGARRAARLGGADGVRLRSVLRLRGRGRRRAEATLRGGAGAPQSNEGASVTTAMTSDTNLTTAATVVALVATYSGVRVLKIRAEGRSVRPTRRSMLALAVLGAVVMAGIGASVPATAAVSRPTSSFSRLRRRSRRGCRAAGVTPTHVYRHALKGYAAPMSTCDGGHDRRSAERPLRRARRHRDDRVTQSPATWGLDRIDQRNLPLEQLVHRTRRPAPA